MLIFNVSYFKPWNQLKDSHMRAQGKSFDMRIAHAWYDGKREQMKMMWARWNTKFEIVRKKSCDNHEIDVDGT